MVSGFTIKGISILGKKSLKDFVFRFNERYKTGVKPCVVTEEGEFYKFVFSSEIGMKSDKGYRVTFDNTPAKSMIKFIPFMLKNSYRIKKDKDYVLEVFS